MSHLMGCTCHTLLVSIILQLLHSCVCPDLQVAHAQHKLAQHRLIQVTGSCQGRKAIGSARLPFLTPIAL